MLLLRPYPEKSASHGNQTYLDGHDEQAMTELKEVTGPLLHNTV